MPPAAEHLPELRTEAAACLVGVDPRPVRTFSDDFGVYSLAYSADGRWLAVAGRWPDGAVGRVRIRDADDGRVVRELTYEALAARAPLGQDRCHRLLFSPDGRWLFASTTHSWLRRWDLKTETPQAASWRPHSRANSTWAIELAFGVVRPLLITAGEGMTECWDASDGFKVLHQWETALRSSRPVVDPATGRVSVYHYKSTPPEGWYYHLLDGATLRPVRPPVATSDRTALSEHLVASPCGRFFASRDGRSLWLADAEPGRLLRQLTLPDSEDADADTIGDIAFSPDGTLLASSSEWTRRVKVWDVARGRLLADFAAGGAGSRLRLAFRPGGRTLAVAADHKAVIYEVTGAAVASTVALQPHPPFAAALDPSGRSLACLATNYWERNNLVSCWSAGPGAVARPTLWFEQDDPRNRTRNRRVIAAGSSGGLVFTSGDGLEYRPAAGQPLEVLPIEELKAIAFGPDGRLWAAAGHDVRAFALPGWRETAKWSNDPEARDAGSHFYTVAPGKTWVLAGRRDGKVFLFDPAGNRRATWPIGGDLPVSALAMYEGAGIVAAGDEAGRVRVFRVPTGEIIADLPEAHRDAVTAAAVSPDGQLLATGGRDRAIRLWRPDGSAVLTLSTFGPVTMLAFTPTGAELYALVDGERGVRRWHLGRLADRLREHGIDPGY